MNTAKLLKEIAFVPTVNRHKAVRKNSKTATLLTALLRDRGVTLTEAAKLLSKTGAECTPAYARAWIAPSYLAVLGYGVRSSVEGEKPTKEGAKDRRQLRLWAFVNDASEPAIGIRDGHVDPVAEASKADASANAARARKVRNVASEDATSDAS
jgi:hypothetical protein